MATLQQNQSGAFTANDLNGSTEIPNGGTQTSSYDRANMGLMYILSQAQGAGSQAPLYAQQNQMQNQALNLSNPLSSTPYASLFQGMGYAGTAAEQQTQQAFQPGLTAISSQIAAAQSASNQLNQNVQTAGQLLQNQKNTISPGQTLIDSDGNVIYEGTNFGNTPQLNTDPSSAGYGQLDYLSPNGQWLSDMKGATKSANGTSSVVPPIAPGQQALVGGVDVAGYNGNQNPTYASDVNRSYTTLEASMPNGPTAAGIDSFIQNNGKGSSVTGTMIMNAAANYGVPPLVLAAVLNDESGFGTAGQGVKTMNPGNVQSNGADITYGSWQQGINAAAQTLAQHMPGNQYASGTGTPNAQNQSTGKNPVADPTGNIYNSTYVPLVSQLSTAIQPFVLAAPGGAAYINGDAASAANPQLGQLATIQGSKLGLPVLNAQDISTMDNINQLATGIQTMQAMVNKTLSGGGGSSTVGFLRGLLTTGLNDTLESSPNLTQFTSYITSVTNAADELKTLAGGEGSGLRITGAELAGTFTNLPSTKDSLQTAQAKLNSLSTKLSEWMNTNFPQVSATTTVLPALQASQSYTMVGPKGTFTVPASQAQTMANNGYYIDFSS